MNVKDISDRDLWQARLKIIGWGEDIVGQPAGEAEVTAIQDEIMARGLANEESLGAFARGVEYHKASHYRSAAPRFLFAIKTSPKFLDAYSSLGGCLIDMGDLDEARKVLQEGRKLGLTVFLTENIDRLNRLAGKSEVHEPFVFSRAEEAEKACEVIPEIHECMCEIGDPDDPQRSFDAFIDTGYQSYVAGDYDRSIELYTYALVLLTLSPEEISTKSEFFVQFYNRRGLACFKAGRYTDAIDDFSDLIKRLRTWDEAYYNRGYCYFSMGLYERAIADFTKSLEIEPTDAVSFNMRGVSRKRFGQHDLAIDDFSRALEIDPDLATARGNLERMCK